MKPRNRYERRVAELHEKLPPITAKQAQWAMEHCFTDAYYYSDNVWCLHCGEEFTPDHALSPSVLGEVTCPSCGRVLKTEYSTKKKEDIKEYYSIVTTFRGYQVIRHFMVGRTICRKSKYPHVDKKPVYRICEVVQNWIDESGRETIIAKSTAALSLYYDAWVWCSEMSIKESHYRYDIDSIYGYPWRKVLPVLKRNGYYRVDGIPENILMKKLLKSHVVEMLIKNKQESLVKYFCRTGGVNHLHSVRIANRNKYIVKDALMWQDYLDYLDYFGLDTHNAHYVCPADLKEAHDRMANRHRQEEERRKAESEKEAAKKYEAAYARSKGMYFGICFGNEDIVITVIQSVMEMLEEGETMHHCVYRMGYYKKKNSLILSAKDKTGERIETIELNMKSWMVVQSRGVCNSNTDKHDEIINLVRKNIGLFKKIQNGSKKKTASA